MATFAETIDLYKSEFSKMGIKYDENLLSAVSKGLGPSIYNTDASRVSCSDQSEKDRIKTNFLVGKLGLANGPALDAAIDEVCGQLGTSNTNKYRGMFYYLLVVKFGKQGMYK